MQGLLSLALALWTLVATVSAHGIMRSPTPRIPGATLRKVCGDGIANLQSTDLNRAGHIQGLVMYNKEIKDHNACNIWLCKGYQFDDNKSNVQSYSGGEVVPIRVELIAVSRLAPMPPPAPGQMKFVRGQGGRMEMEVES